MTLRTNSAIDNDLDMQAITVLHTHYRQPHNGFALAPCAAYSQAVSDLTDETAAVHCMYHRDRAATYQIDGQPMCSSCASEALVWPEAMRHGD